MTRLVLCRFNENRSLSRHEVNIYETPYIAVSHIWCRASWCSIPGISWKVLASPQKAEWVSEKLPHLVGSTHFWMDILAIDQADSAARVAVVDHIPILYINAQRTIAVREEGGFQSCCANVVPEYRDEIEDSKTKEEHLKEERLIESHFKDCHSSGIEEVWLDRLWPLQETMLSNTLQFTVCRSSRLKHHSDTWKTSLASLDLSDSSGTSKDSKLALKLIRPLFDSLHSVAEAWMDHGLFLWKGSKDSNVEIPWQQHADLHDRFISAMLRNTTVSRSTERYAGFQYSPYNTLADESKSRRRTSKSRDFILALFPQFKWYEKPVNVLSMTFGEIFVDALGQWRRNNNENLADMVAPRSIIDFYPLVPAGLITSLSITPQQSFEGSSELPTPYWFGDFTKLICFSQFHKPPLHQASQSTWSLQSIDETSTDSMDKILDAIGHTIWFGSFEYWLDFDDYYYEWYSAKPEVEKDLRQARSRLEELDDKGSIEELASLRRTIVELEQRLGIFPEHDVATALVYIHEVYRRARETLAEASNRVMSGDDLQLRMQGGIMYAESDWWALHLYNI
jgi:hypothetical protein